MGDRVEKALFDLEELKLRLAAARLSSGVGEVGSGEGADAWPEEGSVGTPLEFLQRQVLEQLATHWLSGSGRECTSCKGLTHCMCQSGCSTGMSLQERGRERMRERERERESEHCV
ncbi:unnamed protein product [Effrenium voratum]|nr:unnamed protein product [Effrenium voratum]